MKSKIKYIMIGILISIIILFIINIITTNININTIINIKDYDSYEKDMNLFKEKIDKIKDEKCMSSLNEMYERINKTHFTHDVTLKEYYQTYYKDNNDFIFYYKYVLSSCNLKEDNNIYLIAMSSEVFPTMIKNEYELSHELIIKDINSRKIKNKTLNEMGSYTSKINEMKVLDELINKVLK